MVYEQLLVEDQDDSSQHIIKYLLTIHI